MKVIFSYLWQLPQNLLGLLLLLIVRPEMRVKDGIRYYYREEFNGGISLGEYIIVCSDDMVRHEYGHTLQSRKLGWLYLLIVGLPSLIHAGFCRCVNHDYTDYWCEKWADKLGGVQR